MSSRCFPLRQVRCVRSYRPAGHGACAGVVTLVTKPCAVVLRRFTHCQTYAALYNHFDRISASNFVCESARIPHRLSIGNPTPEKQSSVDTDSDRPPGGCGRHRGLNGADVAKKNMGDDSLSPAKHSPAGFHTHGKQ